jgi:hypothetical protein
MKKLILFLAAVFLVSLTLYSQSIRKNYKEMGPIEITDYNDALQQFWNSGANSATSGLPTGTSWLADFSIMHFETGVTVTGHTSIHNSIYFLPWHRAFLLDYEERMRSFANLSFPFQTYKYLAIPYWDWRDEANPGNSSPITSITHPGFLPFSFVPNSNFAGWSFSYFSPFLSSPQTVNFSRNTTFGSPATLNSSAGPTQVNNVMGSSSYYDWTSGSSGFTNRLEQVPHNNMHGFIGGIMSSYYSPLDPIFFMHHNMVDKLWQDWEDLSTVTYASTDITTLPYSATPPFQTTPVTYPSTLPLYTSEQCSTKVDSRYLQFNSNMYDVWFAESGKVLINGNKGTDFNISSGPKIYRYTVYNSTFSSYQFGEMYVGDIKRSGTFVANDTKGGVIISGGSVHFRAGASITFRPGFTVSVPSGSNEITAKTISAPDGF